MRHELRVPVSRLDARLHTDDGESHEVTVFLPPGSGLEYLLEASEPFLPVSEEGRIRIYARSSLAAVSVQTRKTVIPPRAEDEFLTETRALSVRLRGGAVLEGTLRHAPGQSRTADLLNDPAPNFSLESDGITHRITKSQVTCVDEV
jgi:hypothetical protein